MYLTSTDAVIQFQLLPTRTKALLKSSLQLKNVSYLQLHTLSQLPFVSISIHQSVFLLHGRVQSVGWRSGSAPSLQLRLTRAIHELGGFVTRREK